MNKNLIITGSVGSGKSTIMDILKTHPKIENYVFISYDEQVDMLYTNECVQNVLKSIFQTCDKSEISKIVFTDENKLKTLNEIFIKYVNPLIEMINNLSKGEMKFIFEFPLYFEACEIPKFKAARELMDNFSIVNVSLPYEIQIDRIVKRAKEQHPHWSQDMIDAIIESQINPILKNIMADYQIINAGNKDTLHVRVDDVLDEIENNKPSCSIPHNHLYRIIWLYKKSTRFYHTFDHILFMLKQIDGIKDIPYLKALRYAILFHDIVYETTEHEVSNEQASVDMMEKFHIDDDLVDIVKMMILSTETHTLSETFDYNQYPGLLETHKLFLDLDLFIFAQPFDDVLTYDQNIRKEYSHIDELTFNFNRLRVLKNLEKMQYFYKSALLGTIRNNQMAYENLQKLIQMYITKVNV